MQRLGLADAILEVEILAFEGDAWFGPKPLDDLRPFLGQVVARVMVEARVPGVHLLELAAIGAGHDVEPGAAARDVIQGGDHLRCHRRIVQDRVQGRPDFYPAGDRGDPRQHGDGLQAMAPMAGVAAKAAPLAHRHDEIQALAFRQQRRLAVLGPATVQHRGVAADDPAAVCDGQENAELLHVPLRCGGRMITTASMTSATAIDSAMKNGRKLPV